MGIRGLMAAATENERLIADLKGLDKRVDELTPEERNYAELLTVLIEASKTPTRPLRIDA